MTTRRSRLKAVANLPVRRKIPAFEGGADTNSSLDNFASSNGTPSNVKNDVSNTQNDVGSSYEFKKTIYVTAPENKSISGSNYENNTNNKNKVANCEDNIQQNPIAEPSVQVENNLDSFRETEEIQKSNKSNEACLTSNNSCNNSSPYECNRTHEENLVSSIPRQENPNFLMQTSVASDILRTENNNIKETLDSFALDSNSILKTSMPAMSIPLTSYANTDPTATVTNSNAQNSNNDFNGLQIYSNLVEPTDLYVNMPKLVSSETTDNTDFLDSEESGPILTTLLNCSAQCDFNNINKIANYKERNLMPSEKNTQELFLNDTCKNTGVIEVINYSESDGVSRNIINPDRDKVLGDNLVYHSSQDHNQLNSASSTNISRRNIATVKRKRSKCSDFTKKLADARREFQKKYEKTKPDRSTLKMIDLIFYNPATNPMESKTKSDKKEPSLQTGLLQETLAEEEIDEPQPLDSSHIQASDLEIMNLRMPVPQVKIGLNGEIILDEKSVIIETTEAKRGRDDLIKNSVPIFEDRGSRVSYYRGKTRKTRDWTDFETKRFYKALNTIGPDFSLMQKYFPKRSRLELKNKFKREERLNRNLIDKALINPSEFDMTQLEKDLDVEKQAEEKEIEMKLSRGMKDKHTSKRPRTKSSLFGREMIEFDGENEGSQVISNNVNSSGMFQNEKDKKKRELGFIFKKIVLNNIDQELSEKSEISTSNGLLQISSNHVVT